MPKPILPDDLRLKISTLIEYGLSTIDIYDQMIDEAAIHTELDGQVIFND